MAPSVPAGVYEDFINRVVASSLQVKTHLQAQAVEAIAVGHQHNHQVRWGVKSQTGVCLCFINCVKFSSVKTCDVPGHFLQVVPSSLDLNPPCDLVIL